MDLFLHIGQGAGLAAAVGLRPFLPAVLAGVLAGQDAVLDFDHTSYGFLESTPFLIAVAVTLAIVTIAQRRIGAERFADGPLGAMTAGVGIGLGAVVFAAVMAQHHDSAWAGLIAGFFCAALAQLSCRGLLARARARLEDEAAREALTLYIDGAALLLAAFATFLAPASYVAILFFAWLLIAEQRRGGDKYAGLRVLR
jgi:phosphatidylserine synthase